MQCAYNNGVPGDPPRLLKVRSLALGGVAALALAAGLAVYVLGRAPGSAMAWPAAWSLGLAAEPLAGSSAGRWWGVLVGSLPSFAHALAFAVLSVLLLPRTRGWAVMACATWGLIDTLFEVLQHPALSGTAAHGLQGLGLSAPLQWCADKTARYLAQGQFDVWDVMAGVLGAAVAYVLCRTALPTSARPAG